MDSISQGVLGGAVSGIVGGKKLGKKVYRRGIVLGTLPDLDVFVGPLLYNDALQAMFFHRGPTHSLFFAVIAAPIFAYIINTIHKGNKDSRWTWTLIAFLAFVTHIGLDALTNYGTKLLRPFTNVAYSLNTIFIVDPLYTIPFLGLFIVAVCIKNRSIARKVNARGVCISIVYLMLGIILKYSMIVPVFEQAQMIQDKQFTQSFTTPEALQTFLRRQVAINPTDFVQGWYSVFDTSKYINYHTVPRTTELIDPYRESKQLQKILERTQGYYIVRPRPDGGVFLIDVRFGGLNGWMHEEQEYIFGYSIYEENGTIVVEQTNPSETRQFKKDDFAIWWERVKGI